MANENWRPGTGKSIPTNTPIKVDPKFSTITSSNPSGYVPFYAVSTGPNAAYYAINDDGVVTFKFGPGPSTELFQADVENTLNDFASRTKGAKDGFGVFWRARFQAILQGKLEQQAPQVGVTPSPTLPTPAQGAQGQTPGAADPGPNNKETAPTNALSQFNPDQFGKKENFRALKYPITMNSKQDRIFISQVRYKRTGVVQREGDFAKLEPVGSVTLPIPNDITETNSVGWGEDSLSNAAARLMGPLTEGASIIASGENMGQLSNVGDKIMKVLNDPSVGQRVRQTLTTRAAASLIGKLGIQVNPEAYITRATGAAINPNLELLFSGPKLRQFGFQFKMTPRSQNEATEIRKIIRFFKQGMSPRKGSGDTSFFLGTPNVFKLKFLSGEGGSELKSIGRIKTCALVSFAVNYTPDGLYAAFNDALAGGSQPISVTIQMGFTELTPIFNDEYDATYDDIGPNINSVTADNLGAETPAPQPGDPEFIGPVPGDTAATIEARQRAAGIPIGLGQNSKI
jgi:hypothetical protein